jgi:hypothetical protein
MSVLNKMQKNENRKEIVLLLDYNLLTGPT